MSPSPLLLANVKLGRWLPDVLELVLAIPEVAPPFAPAKVDCFALSPALSNSPVTFKTKEAPEDEFTVELRACAQEWGGSLGTRDLAGRLAVAGRLNAPAVPGRLNREPGVVGREVVANRPNRREKPPVLRFAISSSDSKLLTESISTTASDSRAAKSWNDSVSCKRCADSRSCTV